MIETIMLFALGFTAAGILALLIAPAAWRRAVRLTTRKLQATMPISVADINADKDLLRAEYAVEIRRLEMALERAQSRAARHLMERNQHNVEIGKLKAEIEELERTVEERKHASSVLEQTVQKRVPELETDLERTLNVVAAREQEIAERVRAYDVQTESLEFTQGVIRRQEEEIEKLRGALEGGIIGRLTLRRKRGGSDDDEATMALKKENGRLQAELSRLREEFARLRETEMADAEGLRAEMQRLADMMLARTPVTKKAAEKTAPKTPEATAMDEAAEKPKSRTAKSTRKKTTARKATPKAKTAARARKSLSERLASLRPKREKQKEKEKEKEDA
ncbi:MAG: hypothetical protein MPJ78_14730 [Hyphomicrobiaceae bacterium]|nr:hypothetical protein [Hyphomicrobiaceae bacterium]